MDVDFRCATEVPYDNFRLLSHPEFDWTGSSEKKRRYLRATVAAHLLLLLIYAGVAISQWVSYRTTPSHHGENLSGFLWVSIYMLLAFLTPIIFLSIWIGTSQKSDALKGAPDKPQRPVDPDKATH